MMISNNICFPKSCETDDILAEAFEIVGSRKKEFDESGVSLSVYIFYGHDNSQHIYDIPDEKLVGYADVVTVAFPDAVLMSEEKNPHDYSIAQIMMLNITAWGNMAYIAQHAAMAANRTNAKIYLMTWRAIMGSRLLRDAREA